MRNSQTLKISNTDLLKYLGFENDELKITHVEYDHFTKTVKILLVSSGYLEIEPGKEPVSIHVNLETIVLNGKTYHHLEWR